MDALATYEPKSSGVFLKIVSGEPVVLRILTLDPLVAIDKWGGTKYAFTVWNWNEGRAQIWQATPGLLKQLTAIHRNDNFDPLNKVDVEVSATGEMLEKRYTIMPLPKAKDLTAPMVEEAKLINLEEKIPENQGRLSSHSEDGESPDEPSGYDKAKATSEVLKPKQAVDEVYDVSDEPVDLSDIPF